MPDKPLTVEQVAERWGVSASHVRNLIKQGHLKAAALGQKTLRISIETVITTETNGIPYYNERIAAAKGRAK